MKSVNPKSVMRSAIGVLLLMVLAGVAGAQISLNSAVDLALKSDPRVRSAEASVKKAEAVLSEARDVYIPSVGVKGGYGTSSGVPLNVPVVFSIGSESLLFNFSQKDNVRAAGDGLQAAKLGLQDAREQTVEDVVTTYLHLDNLERQQAAANEQKGFAAKLVSIVQDRLDAGQDTRMDLLKARRTAAQIHVAGLNVEDELAIANDHLDRLLGLPGLPLKTVTGSIPAMPPIESLVDNGRESPSVQASFAGALSKQEAAFGEARYRYRPQVAFGANYSRISTSHTSYTDYYPGFLSHHSDNALSVGIEISIPILDFEHQAHSRESSAEAAHAMAEAQGARSQFLEGRYKLRHSIEELAARSTLAGLDRDIAEEQLETLEIQLNNSSSEVGSAQLTPKDQQNSRLQVRQRMLDVLRDEYELDQAEINLMRQTGKLGAWLTQLPVTTVTSPAAH